MLANQSKTSARNSVQFLPADFSRSTVGVAQYGVARVVKNPTSTHFTFAFIGVFSFLSFSDFNDFDKYQLQAFEAYSQPTKNIAYQKRAFCDPFSLLLGLAYCRVHKNRYPKNIAQRLYMWVCDRETVSRALEQLKSRTRGDRFKLRLQGYSVRVL